MSSIYADRESDAIVRSIGFHAFVPWLMLFVIGAAIFVAIYTTTPPRAVVRVEGGRVDPQRDDVFRSSCASCSSAVVPSRFKRSVRVARSAFDRPRIARSIACSCFANTFAISTLPSGVR